MSNVFGMYIGATETTVIATAYTLAALALDQESMQQLEAV